MNLRTTSIRRQHQAWACLALLGVVAYFVLVSVLGLGNPFRFFGSHQMRVLLPLVVLLRLLAREFRWDGIVREEVKSKSEKGRSAEEEDLGRRSRSTVELKIDSAEQPVDATSSSRQKKEVSSFVVRDGGIASTKETNHQSPPPPPFSTSPAVPTADAAALWERARVMPHNVIPDVMEDASYLELVHAAAEAGHVAALAKLGDYAFRRQAYVEAYFWTKMAHRRLELSDPTATEGLKEIEGMLRNIRRQWSAAGQPLEEENVYNHFSLARGELGRAFLGLDGGYEVRQARDYLQLLAEKGNADAALFIEK